jgi:CRISPR-associated protein Cas2
MRWIVCYDIPSDSKRERLARWLDGFGDRIQDSVFEADIDNDLVGEMWAGVEQMVDPAVDKVVLVPVCASCEDKRQWIGAGTRLDKLDVVVWVV